jgi:hypothetical protein
MKICLLLLLLTALSTAEGAWKHYRLDVSLTVPVGWKIIQGPGMLSLDPKQRMKAERRPKFGLTWQQAPSTLEEFQGHVVQSIKQTGGTVVFAKKLTVSGYPAARIRALVPEKIFKVTADVILVRVDNYAGYMITMESFAQDTPAADTHFSQILKSLKLGPRPRKVELPVKND